MAIEIRNISPKNGEINIPIDNNIEFNIVGTNGNKIDINTLEISIEMISKITGDVLTDVYSVRNVTSVQYSGTEEYYKVFVNPEKPFEHGMNVTVKINVSSVLMLPMTQYSVSFLTVYRDLISDFTYAFIYRAQNIPIYNEILRGNSTASPKVFDSAFQNWNQKPRIEVLVNQVISESDYTIDYSEGKIIFDSSLEYNDQVKSSYTFRSISDKQIQQYFQQATSIWRNSPPYGGPLRIYNADLTVRNLLFVGAAQLALNDLLYSLAFQESRIVYDNRSWGEGWKTSIDLFKSLRDNYKDIWEKALEGKKVRLPSISSMITPEYTLPGGRSRFFRYLYKQGSSGL